MTVLKAEVVTGVLAGAFILGVVIGYCYWLVDRKYPNASLWKSIVVCAAASMGFTGLAIFLGTIGVLR